MKFKTLSNRKEYSMNNINNIKNIKETEAIEAIEEIEEIESINGTEEDIHIYNIDHINLHSTKYITLQYSLYGILFVSVIYYFYSNIITSAF